MAQKPCTVTYSNATDTAVILTRQRAGHQQRAQPTFTPMHINLSDYRQRLQPLKQIDASAVENRLKNRSTNSKCAEEEMEDEAHAGRVATSMETMWMSTPAIDRRGGVGDLPPPRERRSWQGIDKRARRWPVQPWKHERAKRSTCQSMQMRCACERWVGVDAVKGMGADACGGRSPAPPLLGFEKAQVRSSSSPDRARQARATMRSTSNDGAL